MTWLSDLDNVADALSRKTEGLSVQRIALDRIAPDPNQPRKVFDQKALEEMAQSIEARGILQPITVRTRDGGKTYVIRYGERRWRAAGLAGLSEIPAIVTESEADENELIDQIIENDQRADLSPIEMAEAVKAMIADGHSKETISKRLGRPRLDITMYAAFYDFPPELAGEFIQRSSLRAAYDLFVAWKRSPEEVLSFVASHPAGVTTARAAAFVKGLKGTSEPLHMQRPDDEGREQEERELEPSEQEPQGQAKREETTPRVPGAEVQPGATKPEKTKAAPKEPIDREEVFVTVRIGGRAARVRLPEMIEVAFDDGEVVTMAATEIDHD